MSQSEEDMSSDSTSCEDLSCLIEGHAQLRRKIRSLRHRISVQEDAMERVMTLQRVHFDDIQTLKEKVQLLQDYITLKGL